MILSFDTIMNKPPYQITSQILKLVSEISEKIGVIKAAYLNKPPTELRKKSRIKTIQSSLEIEGNTLTEEQITAILNNKRIIAPAKDVLEVKNAIRVYDQLDDFTPTSLNDFKKTHKSLMTGLVDQAGVFRKSSVGIIKGSKVQHLAPPGNMVTGLMKELFHYLKNSKELSLIKSCVFHYELEFIHPFADGNGRMGRLWQTVILMKEYPLFQFLPIESIIKKQQKDYYVVLNKSDKTGQATFFVEFMLQVIDEALEIVLKSQRAALTNVDRLTFFKEYIEENTFSRQDYLIFFKNISSSTASRDLKLGVDKKILKKEGDKRMANYNYRK